MGAIHGLANSEALPRAEGLAPPRADTRTLITVALSATAGVTVEFYDFFLYGYAAASAFPSIFFPNLEPTQALVFSYLAFAAGFPARLLGAFVFGHIGDRAGRKTSFLVGIALVGSATCLTALLPGYATWGIASPILLVALRILQGVGLGGEFGGAVSLLGEFGATRRYRAFWVALANLGIPLGAMLASGALLLFSDTFATTGWRAAMLLSLVIVVPAIVARRSLADSPLFERIKQREQLAKLPSMAVCRTHAVPILLIALMSAFQQMDGYVSGTYLISFMRSAGIGLSTVAVLLFVARVGDALGVVVSGLLSDVFRRKRVAYVGVIAATLISIPLTRMVLDRNIAVLAVTQFLIAFFGVGLLHGIAPIMTAELFPTKYRYSGAGIAYNLSAILGGGIAPALLAGLIGQDIVHRWFYLPAVYAAYCLVAIVALRFIPETRDVVLTQLDDEP